MTLAGDGFDAERQAGLGRRRATFLLPPTWSISGSPPPVGVSVQHGVRLGGRDACRAFISLGVRWRQHFLAKRLPGPLPDMAGVCCFCTFPSMDWTVTRLRSHHACPLFWDLHCLTTTLLTMSILAHASCPHTCLPHTTPALQRKGRAQGGGGREPNLF